MGWYNVDALLEQMSSTLFSEWAAYYQLEPWGPERGDLQAGIVASVIANTHRDAKRGPEPFAPQDFMPDFNAQPVKAQPWQVLLEKVRIANAAFGGEDLTDGG